MHELIEMLKEGKYEDAARSIQIFNNPTATKIVVLLDIAASLRQICYAIDRAEVKSTGKL